MSPPSSTAYFVLGPVACYGLMLAFVELPKYLSPFGWERSSWNVIFELRIWRKWVLEFVIFCELRVF
jgi:hypothetical protein